ncbi:hypothetical protein CTI12_AA415170 [Artemisia annua]|uniref:Uncharacterized protein n=1 Tax=Artemisia annua TaxID=35608 RepID=A0A2U1M5F7_ARTAN|nr:hypothetical protein CTI12_AA415170 [Artemisia annua]
MENAGVVFKEIKEIFGHDHKGKRLHVTPIRCVEEYVKYLQDQGDYMWSRYRSFGYDSIVYNQCVSVTQSYKHFDCQDVSTTILWPDSEPNKLSGDDDGLDKVSTANHPPSLENETIGKVGSPLTYGCSSNHFRGTISCATNGCFSDRMFATWPEEKIFRLLLKCEVVARVLSS